MDAKVDWNHALDAVGGSVELLLEIIDIFFAEYPKLIAGIESSIESKALVELRRYAHTLKGSLRYFGELRICQLAHDLEVMGRDDQLEQATTVLGELRGELDTLIPEMKAFVAAQSPETDA